MKYILHNRSNIPLTNIEKSKIAYETIIQGKSTMIDYLKQKKFKVIWKGGEILKALKKNNLKLAKRLNNNGASFGNLGQELTYVCNHLDVVDVKTVAWVLKYTYLINPSEYYIKKILKYVYRFQYNYNPEYLTILSRLVDKASPRVLDKYRIRWSPDRKELLLLCDISKLADNMKEWINKFLQNNAKWSKEGGEIGRLLNNGVNDTIVKYAIDHGAKFKGNELNVAIREEYSLDMINYLIGKKAKWSGNEISTAIISERTNIVKDLVRKKAPWNGHELHYIMELENTVELLKFLLKHDIPVDEKALEYTAKYEKIDAMKVLLESKRFPWSSDGKELRILCRKLRKINGISNDSSNTNNNIESERRRTTILYKMLRLCIIYKATVPNTGMCSEYQEIFNTMKKSVNVIERVQFQRKYNPYNPSFKRKAGSKINGFGTLSKKHKNN